MSIETDYQHTLNYLYERLPMFSRIGKAALKPDLTNILKLCGALGDPQNRFKSVHIAGTNGKGSTSHALSAVLQYAGYKTGLCTSPHLVDFRERIRINGVQISRAWVVDFINKHKDIIADVKPSFFEITIAMAFQAFAEANLDIAVVETGMGGKTDSTNVITPLLSIITNISNDHQDLLGHTIPEIAAHKAGIIKPAVPVVIGEQQPETERLFLERSVQLKSPLYYAESMWDLVRVSQDAYYQHYKAVDTLKQKIYSFKTDMTGQYQQHNIKTVLAAAELLSYSGFDLPIENCLEALGKVKLLTGLRGRWEWLQVSPPVICDVAHNSAGLTEVLQQWDHLNAERKHIVVGFVRDKDVATALALFPKDNTYYFCNADMPRALPADELQLIANSVGLNGHSYHSVSEAVNAARAAMSDTDALLITGSFFIVGTAMETELFGNIDPEN